MKRIGQIYPNQGFAHIILLILLSVAIVAGAIYYSSQKLISQKVTDVGLGEACDGYTTEIHRCRTGLVCVHKPVNGRLVAADSPGTCQYPSPTQSQTPTTNWKTYANEKYRFQFKYPSSLTIDSKQSNESRIELTGENGKLLDIMINPLGYSPPMPNKEFTGIYKEGEGIVITNTKMLDPSEMRDFNDKRIIYVLPGVKFNDNQLDFIFQYKSPDSQPRLEDDMFNQILSTFIFLPYYCDECPQYTPPSPDFCKNGTVIPGKMDSCSCQKPPTCKDN